MGDGKLATAQNEEDGKAMQEKLQRDVMALGSTIKETAAKASAPAAAGKVKSKGPAAEGMDFSGQQMTRIASVLRVQGPRLHAAAARLVEDAWRWAKSGPAWRTIVFCSVAGIGSAVIGGIGFFLLVLLFSVTSAIILASVITLWAAGAFTVMLLATIASICIGTVAVAGIVIGALTFGAVCLAVMSTGSALSIWLVYKVVTVVIASVRRLMRRRPKSATLFELPDKIEPLGRPAPVAPSPMLDAIVDSASSSPLEEPLMPPSARRSFTPIALPS